MNVSKKRGFTLIELLVVIAIIGLLASIILASLNTARQKGRDARRVADLKEIQNAMALVDNGTSGTTVTCTVAPTNSAGVAASTCTVPAMQSFIDPSGSVAACAKNGAASCAYTILSLTASAATTQNWEVCTYLESGSGSLNAGMINISSATSSLNQGCY